MSKIAALEAIIEEKDSAIDALVNDKTLLEEKLQLHIRNFAYDMEVLREERDKYLNWYAKASSSANTHFSRVTELEAEKNEMQSVINRQAGIISSFKIALGNVRTILERVFYTIAKDLVTEKTHRERNEVYRSLARMIDDWLSQAHDTPDMDDIPF